MHMKYATEDQRLYLILQLANVKATAVPMPHVLSNCVQLQLGKVVDAYQLELLAMMFSTRMHRELATEFCGLAMLVCRSHAVAH